MNATVATLPPGGRYRGVLQILRYNLPQYAAALASCVAGAAALALFPLPWPLALAAGLGIAAAAYWSLASLAASWWIYDRSPLGRWEWLAAHLPTPPRRWVSLHAGLDETFGALERIFGAAAGAQIDIYDGTEMTEPSIARARRLHLSPATPADFRALPFPDASLDAAFLIFAAHELRPPAARQKLFLEIARCLAPGGRVVLVEHLRDLPNFLAFGPGFMHFLPRRAWIQAVDEAGLALVEERRITPFVAVLVLEKAP